jgi:hypothetical protein
MTIVVNNTEAVKAKQVMDSLMVCMNDKSISKAERTQYYKDYIEISKNYLILIKHA